MEKKKPNELKRGTTFSVVRVSLLPQRTYRNVYVALVAGRRYVLRASDGELGIVDHELGSRK